MIINYLKKAALLALLNISFAQAQPFFPVGSGVDQPIICLHADTITNILFAGGDFTLAGNISCNYIASWNGSVWDSTNNQLLSHVRSIEELNNEIYIGGSIGWFDTSGNIIAPYVAKWDSSINAWIDFGANANATTFKLYTYNNSLYIMGQFDSIGGIYSPMIGRYDGTNWYAFPPLDTSGGGYAIDAAMFYNGELYVGGNFNSQIASNMKDIAKWNGISWLSVGSGLSGGNTWVNDFTIYQGKLIVAGLFSAASGDPGNNIAAWNGIQWSQLGSAITTGHVKCLQVFNNELWVGGAFSDAGGIAVNFLAKWDGQQWIDPGAGLNGVVTSMAVLGNDLYIGGSSTTSNGVSINRIIRYNPLTGFQSLEPEKNIIEIFPNPAADYIAISDKECKNISVFNSLGATVKSFNKINSSIYVADLPVGLYLIKFEDNNGNNQTARFIKQ